MIVLQAQIDESLINLMSRIRQFNMGLPSAVLFPTAKEAAQSGAMAIQEQWKAYASGEPLPSGEKIKRPTGGYAASIQMTRSSLWDYKISSKASVASWLENGTEEIDFKQTHPYGDRGRVANKGTKKNPRWVPYVIIPIRWATPGSGAHMGVKNVIPEQVYRMVQAGIKKGTFARSVVLDEKTASSNFWGNMQARSTYSWGSRVNLPGSNMNGMAVMAGPQKANGARQSSYMTFRVISADSPSSSWIKPATKPLRIAEQTAEKMQEGVSRMIEEGLIADLEGMKG